jgi:enoyl-[acyl-carrier protein] reductase II
MNKITTLLISSIQQFKVEWYGIAVTNSASAVSAGGLGLIGAGSMYPEVLREHIQKCKKATSNLWVNVSSLYSNIEEIMKIIVEKRWKLYLHQLETENLTSYLKQME